MVPVGTMEEYSVRAQTQRERDQDYVEMARQRRQLEKLFPGSVLSIEEADEWADHWRIPFSFGDAVPTIHNQHWSAISSLGLRLRQQTEGVEGPMYTIDLPKTFHRWRRWKMWHLALLGTFLGLLAASAFLVITRLARLVT